MSAKDKKSRTSHREFFVVSKDAPFQFVEAYKSLRTNLEFLSATSNCKTILITSSVPEELPHHVLVRQDRHDLLQDVDLLAVNIQCNVEDHIDVHRGFIVIHALERNRRIQDRNAHGRMFNMSRDHMRNCCIVLFQFKAGGVIALTLQDSIVKAGLYLPVFQKNFIQLVQSILFTFCFHVCNHTFREKNISHSHLCSSPPFLLYRSAAFAPIQKYGCKGSGTLTPIYVASYVPTFWQNLILF